MLLKTGNDMDQVNIRRDMFNINQWQDRRKIQLVFDISATSGDIISHSKFRKVPHCITGM